MIAASQGGLHRVLHLSSSSALRNGAKQVLSTKVVLSRRYCAVTLVSSCDHCRLLVVSAAVPVLSTRAPRTFYRPNPDGDCCLREEIPDGSTDPFRPFCDVLRAGCVQR